MLSNNNGNRRRRNDDNNVMRLTSSSLPTMMTAAATAATTAATKGGGGKKKAPSKSWIQLSFQKRECAKFISNPKDECRCCCGRLPSEHNNDNVEEQRQQQRHLRSDGHASITTTSSEIYTTTTTCVPSNEIWLPSKHTRPYPTDAYGTIEFQGGPHPTKAQYVRVAYDTRPELLLQLLIKEWKLEMPKLLITVQGGKTNFELRPKLKEVLRNGLLKAAKTTEAWIFTGGTNTGVTRHVGEALLMERSQRCGRVQSVGIAPWGIVENNRDLVGHNVEVPYHAISSPRSKMVPLNAHHANFLLVDNGTRGKYGAEIILRRKLERFISNQVFYPFAYRGTPIVALVIEGGPHTIRAVLEYVSKEPPVPVVVCEGSGRAADLIAFVHKNTATGGAGAGGGSVATTTTVDGAGENGGVGGGGGSTSSASNVLETMRDYLITTIRREFEIDAEKAECLYYELLQCTQKRHLITVFRIADRASPDRNTNTNTNTTNTATATTTNNKQSQLELDQTILTALFKSQHLTPSEQLSLALTWNRVDIARTEIFVYGQEWPPGALDDAMMRALENDRLDFVELLLENGVSMKKFLTIPRLERLYNTKQGPSNTIEYVMRDVVRPQHHHHHLVGVVGGGAPCTPVANSVPSTPR